MVRYKISKCFKWHGFVRKASLELLWNRRETDGQWYAGFGVIYEGYYT
jgi:hypothetical protein